MNAFDQLMKWVGKGHWTKVGGRDSDVSARWATQCEAKARAIAEFFEEDCGVRSENRATTSRRSPLTA